MLHRVGVSFDLYYDARKHKIKICFVSHVCNNTGLSLFLHFRPTLLLTNFSNLKFHSQLTLSPDIDLRNRHAVRV